MLDKEFWIVLGKYMDVKELANHINEIIVMGGGSNENVRKLKKIIEEVWPDRVKHKMLYYFNVPDRVRDAVLQSEYLMIYPHSLEGLGLPVFKAISYTAPVLSSRQTALIEFIPKGLYAERVIKYPDFCYTLMKYFRNADLYVNYAKRLKEILTRYTLNELLRFYKD